MYLEYKMKKTLEFMMLERVFLLSGALAFSGLGILLIHWGAAAEYIMIFFTLANGLVGALLRGLISPGDFKDVNGNGGQGQMIPLYPTPKRIPPSHTEDNKS